jgi:hypothetical protein
MPVTTRTPDRATAVVLILHIVAMFAGFAVLGAVFEFPEVLRYPAPERFAIFAENEAIIRPTYWVLTMTGITQILISVLLYHVVRAQSQTAATLSLIFGTLAGFCQALGFGRWVILIPYFVTETAFPEKAQMAAMLEGAFNHYAGMLVGEHLANICWGVWLASICVVFLRGTNISRALAGFGLALSPLLFLLAGEQIGVSGDVLDPLVDFGFPLLAVWHILLAVQLWHRNGAEEFAGMGRAAWVSGGALAAALIAPALA